MYKISSLFDYKQKNTEEMIQGKSQLFSVDFFFTNKKNARHRGIKFQSCKWTPIGPMLISGTNIDGKDTGHERTIFKNQETEREKSRQNRGNNCCC